MNKPNTKGYTRCGHLVVHSVNAASGQKSIDPTELALNLADHEREKADIILMQEPWVGIPPNKRMTVKTHSNYNVFSPVDSWDGDKTRPRSLIYVRKHLKADQLRPYKTRDITWVKVRGITFVSVYRPSDDLWMVDNILTAWTPPFSCVVAGDFNAGDSSWDGDNPDYHSGAALAKTMRDHGLDLISEPDMPTHDDGNVLDLAFSDIPMAEAAVNEALHSTSDHETLRITVPVIRDLNNRPENRRWIVPDDRLPELVGIVRDRTHELPSPGSSKDKLDRFAKTLVGIIQGAVKVAGKRLSRFGTNVWWNEDCANAVKAYRGAKKNAASQDNKIIARRQFRRITRQAKQKYWRGVIDGAREPKDIFKIIS